MSSGPEQEIKGLQKKYSKVRVGAMQVLIDFLGLEMLNMYSCHLMNCLEERKGRENDEIYIDIMN